MTGPETGQRLVVDIHAHMSVPALIGWAHAYGPKTQLPPAEKLTPALLEEGRLTGQRFGTLMADSSLRLKDMDQAGVDVQVLCSSSVHVPIGWAAADDAADKARQINDRIAEMAATHPDRLLGFGEVPLQDPTLAVRELRRCVEELGFVGAQISSSAGGRELGDAALWPFWEAAQSLGAVIFLHPSGNLDARMQRWQIWNSIGQPFEEAMAMASLIYEGVVDAFPNLQICVAHGGGYLPYCIGRLDRNYKDKPITRVNMTRSPSEYLKFFWYDSCVYDPGNLEALVRKVGIDRIVLGSDYPVGENDPVGMMEQCAGLSAVDKEAIAWRNATTLLAKGLGRISANRR